MHGRVAERVSVVSRGTCLPLVFFVYLLGSGCGCGETWDGELDVAHSVSGDISAEPFDADQCAAACHDGGGFDTVTACSLIDMTVMEPTDPEDTDPFTSDPMTAVIVHCVGSSTTMCL